MTPPTLPDDGTDNGAWAEALRYPPWRLIGPDTFANFTQDAGRDDPELIGRAILASLDEPHSLHHTADDQADGLGAVPTIQGGD